VAFLGSQMPGDWALGDFYGPMREETRLFLEHVTTGRNVPLCDGETGRAVLELTLAMEKSAKEGGSVIELPLKG
jgi:predicted dehydrogenase